MNPLGHRGCYNGASRRDANRWGIAEVTRRTSNGGVMEQGRPATQRPGTLDGEQHEGLVSRLHGMLLGDRRRAPQAELISTLNEVADAVSSALSVEEVLEVIVERAKRVTDTEKALLVLADEHSERLDIDTIVVRGQRARHPQEWWQTRLEQLGDLVFETGEPVLEEHMDENAWLLCHPVLVKDRPIGLLCAINGGDRPFTRVQRDFLAILSAFAASAIENARLAEQSRYVLLASERDRIAREMHDGVVQSLFSISLGLELCKKQVIRDPNSVAVRLDELQQHLNNSMTELRRFIYDLRPMKLTELGLVGAVEYWLSEVNQSPGVRARLLVEGDLTSLSPSQEACLYRVAKEAVSNAVRHAQAGVVEVTIGRDNGEATMHVRDDGIGFDTAVMVDADLNGIGLRSIRERVKREGGSLSIDSQPGDGTVLTVHIPLGRTSR